MYLLTVKVKDRTVKDTGLEKKKSSKKHSYKESQLLADLFQKIYIKKNC